MAYYSYRMKKDRLLGGKIKAREGDIVYDLVPYDYGLARDDTVGFGVLHKSVTLHPGGIYPGFTVPDADLEPIEQMDRLWAIRAVEVQKAKDEESLAAAKAGVTVGRVDHGYQLYAIFSPEGNCLTYTIAPTFEGAVSAACGWAVANPAKDPNWQRLAGKGYQAHPIDPIRPSAREDRASDPAAPLGRLGAPMEDDGDDLADDD